MPPKSAFAGKKLYIQTGEHDDVVWPTSTETTATFFKELGMNVLLKHHGLGHVVPSLHPTRQEFCASHKRRAAGMAAWRWITGTVDCEGWDTVGNMWSFILPTPFKKVADLKALQNPAAGRQMIVDTRPFMDMTAPRRDMNSPKAYLYIPKQCETGGCHLHVHLHGCTEASTEYIPSLMQEDGFTMYAAANNVVVLYPAVLDSGETDIWHIIEKCWHVDQKIPVA